MTTYATNINNLALYWGAKRAINFPILGAIGFATPTLLSTDISRLSVDNWRQFLATGVTAELNHDAHAP
jgi:hypothetical protein